VLENGRKTGAGGPQPPTVKYLLKTLMKCQKLQKQGTMIEREREIVGEKESLGSVQAKSN